MHALYFVDLEEQWVAPPGMWNCQMTWEMGNDVFKILKVLKYILDLNYSNTIPLFYLIVTL